MAAMNRKTRKRRIAAARRRAAARIAANAPPDYSKLGPAALRRRWIDLFLLAVRLSIPVVGVLVLEWPQMMAALLYIFECWLFVMSRTVAENLLRKNQGDFADMSRLRIVLTSVLGLGFFLTMFGGVSLVALIDRFFVEEWDEFAAGGWRDPLFLISLGLVLVQQAYDLIRFVAVWRKGRDRRQQRFNEMEKLSRIGVLFACNFLIGLGGNFGYGGIAQVIAMSALMFWIESAETWKPPVPETPAAPPPKSQPA